MQTAIPDLSATEIRARVHLGQSLEGFTPAAVEDYIGLHRLYDPPPQARPRKIRKALEKALAPGRYRHVLGVVQTMKALAKRWGYDGDRAALTGLLHDCAKGMALPEMNAYVDRQGFYVEPSRRVSTALLHAPAGAAMARAAFGVTDPEILRAIRYHNTGTVPMGMLDKLLCVADMTEPGRRFKDGDNTLERLRTLSMQDLDAAVRETLRAKLSHIEAGGQAAHPDTAAALAAMETTKEGKGTV